MGSSDKGTMQETPAQKEMAAIATARMADYKQRWLPVQQKLAERVTGLGAEDSPIRQRAKGAAAADVRAQFGNAADKVATAQTNSGAGIGSGRFNMAQANLGADEARATGLGVAAADEQIDAQYLAGLGDLMAIGQGQARNATANLSRVAELSGRAAAADAAAAAQERAGEGELIGNVAGAAFGMMKPGGFDPNAMPTAQEGVGILPGQSPYAADGAGIRARR